MGLSTDHTKWSMAGSLVALCVWLRLTAVTDAGGLSRVGSRKRSRFVGAGPLVRSLTASRLAAGSRSATVDSGCRSTAKACRAPSSESNPKGDVPMRRLALFGELARRLAVRRTTIGHGSRMCLRQIPRRGFPRSSRRLAVVTRGAWQQCPPASVGGICAGRSGASLRVRIVTSALRSWWVQPLRRSPFRDRVGPATRAPNLGFEPVAVGLLAADRFGLEVRGTGHRWLAGGERLGAGSRP